MLITATCEINDSEGRNGADICAYLTGSSSFAPETEVLAGIVKRAIETRDVYHTTRSSSKGPNFTSLLQKRTSGTGIWNINSSYGVYTHSFGFLEMLKSLGSEGPVTLGASRSPAACGSQLYRRNMSPGLINVTLMKPRKKGCSS